MGVFFWSHPQKRDQMGAESRETKGRRRGRRGRRRRDEGSTPLLWEHLNRGEDGKVFVEFIYRERTEREYRS